MPDESVLLDNMEDYDEDGTLPADYCALAVAACQEDKTIADFLISKGSNIGQAFSFSANAGYIDAMKYLISKRAHPIPKEDIRDALSFAIEYERTEAVKLILSLGIDVNDINDDELLFEVIDSIINFTKIAELPLDNGTDINIKRIKYLYAKDLKNALQIAIKKSNYKLAQMLINRGIDINSRDINGDSPLISLIKFRKEHLGKEQRILDTRGIIQLLIDKKVDVDAKDNNNKSALMWAAELGDVEIVTLLIRSGVNIKAQDKNGDTALIYAVKSRQQEIVNLLIANGADTVSDFFSAVKNGYIDVVNIILNWKLFNIDIYNLFGETALMLAVKSNRIDVVKLLLRKNSNINIKNIYGLNALMLAVKYENINMVKLLIKKGADINARDFINNDALSLAEQIGNESIIQLLVFKKNKCKGMDTL